MAETNLKANTVGLIALSNHGRIDWKAAGANYRRIDREITVATPKRRHCVAEIPGDPTSGN